MKNTTHGSRIVPEVPEPLITPFSLEHTATVERSLITLTGELDLSVKAEIDAELDRAIRAGLAAIVVDLSGVTFVDSSGVHSLVLAHRRAAQNGQTVFVVRGPAAVQHVLVLCGIAKRVTMLDSVSAFDDGESARDSAAA
jgi:anti-sigma B factor antagonist